MQCRSGDVLVVEPEKSSRALSGVLSVFQTPYRADETIDYGTLEKEIHWLYDRGADGIVMAMVSEVLRLSSQERNQLAEHACLFGHSRAAWVVISVGAESCHTAESYARHAEKRRRRRRHGRAANRRGPR